MKNFFRILTLTLTLLFAAAASAQTATFNKIWVEHNYYHNGTKGMKIHTNWNVEYAVGKRIELGVYFWYASGGMLKDYNGQCRAANGQVAYSIKVTPSYTNTNYSDSWIFLPYSELHMSSGKANLKFNLEAFNSGRSIGRSWDVFFDFSK